MTSPLLDGSADEESLDMRRYLIAAFVAEVIGSISLRFYVAFLHCGVHQKIVEDILSGLDFVSNFKNLSFFHDGCFSAALQLDLLDNCMPFLIGFPAIAVLGVWAYDRWRKQKQQST
jgi:hypothetical protein